MQQHITLMDIYCGALGLGRIRVYNVTKNSNISTHARTNTNESTTDTHNHNPPYTVVTSFITALHRVLNAYINKDNTLIFMIISDQSNIFPFNWYGQSVCHLPTFTSKLLAVGLTRSVHI